MLNISLTEIMIIVVAALVVLGPKDSIRAAFFIGKKFSSFKSILKKYSKDLNCKDLINENKLVAENSFSVPINTMQKSLDTLYSGITSSLITQDVLEKESKNIEHSQKVKIMSEEDKNNYEELTKTELGSGDLVVRINMLEQELSIIKNELMKLENSEQEKNIKEL